jgi:peptidase E
MVHFGPEGYKNFTATIYGGGEVAVNPTSEIFVDDFLDLAGITESEGAVLVVPTARVEQKTHDAVTNWASSSFAKRNVRWSLLHEFGETVSAEACAAKLSASKGIYVPGGDTRAMLKLWNEWGITQTILDAVTHGTVVGGISAGLIAWFEAAHTDSNHYGLADGIPWEYEVIDGLGLLPGVCCPHADDIAAERTFNPRYSGTRRDDFVEKLSADPRRLSGIAVNNHTALQIKEGKATVLGSGKGICLVTLHIWEDDKLVTTEYREGDTFDLAKLRA